MKRDFTKNIIFSVKRIPAPSFAVGFIIFLIALVQSCTGGGPGVFSQSKDVDDSRQERNDGVPDSDGAVTGKILWDGRAKQIINMTSKGSLKDASVTFEINPLSENVDLTLVEGTTMTGTESKEVLSRTFWSPVAFTSALIVDSNEKIDASRDFTIRIPLLPDVTRGIELTSESIAIAYKQIRQDEGGATFYGLLPRSAFKVDSEKVTLKTKYFGQYQLLYLDGENVKGEEVETSNRICRKSQQVTGLSVLDAPTEAIEGWLLEPAIRVSLTTTSSKVGGEAGITKCYNGHVTITPYGLKRTEDMTGTLKVFPVDGVATFSDLQINSLAKDVALNIQEWDGIQVATSSFDVFEKPADRLVFDAQPENLVAGTQLPDISITALNADGKVDPRFVKEVELKATAASKAVTLKGTTKVKAKNGTLKFTGISIEKANADVKLSVVASLMKESFSKAFTVSHAAPAKLKVTSQPASGLRYGEAFSVTVESLDSYENVTTSSTGSVTVGLSVNSAGATLSGTLTRELSSGAVTFSGLSVNKPATDYVIAAAMSGVTSGSTDAFRMRPQAATKIVWDAHPTTVSAGSAFSPNLVVRALDGNDILDSEFTNTVSLAIGNNPGSASLSGTASVAASAGVATFSGLSLNKVGTGYTLVASSASKTSGTSNAFNVNPGSFAALSFAIQPANTIVNQTLSGVKVRALDSAGNHVTSYTGSVALTIATDPPTGTTLTGGSAANMSGGEYTFSGLALNKVGQGFVLRATSGSTTVNSSTFNISASLVSDEPANSSTEQAVTDLTSQTCGGDGSAELPFRICSASHLKMMRQSPTAYFELRNDIDLRIVSVDQLSPIFPLSTLEAPFMGVLNGNGFRIIGAQASLAQPLWGAWMDAQIRDVGFVNMRVKGCTDVGLLVKSMRHSTISGVLLNGRVDSEGCPSDSNGDSVGAIAGMAVDSSFSRVVSIARVARDWRVNKLAGRTEGSINADSIHWLDETSESIDVTDASSEESLAQRQVDRANCENVGLGQSLPQGSGSEFDPYLICTGAHLVWAVQQVGAYAHLLADVDLMDVSSASAVNQLKLKQLDGRGYQVRHATKWGVSTNGFFGMQGGTSLLRIVWQDPVWISVAPAGEYWFHPAEGALVSDVELRGGMAVFSSSGSCSESTLRLAHESFSPAYLQNVSDTVSRSCGMNP